MAVEKLQNRESTFTECIPTAVIQGGDRTVLLGMYSFFCQDNSRENKLLRTIHENINHILNTPTKCTLYICYIYFYHISPTCFPQGKLCLQAQNCQRFTRLFCISCSAILLLWLDHFIRRIFIVVN
jgi:hypothetical protein